MPKHMEEQVTGTRRTVRCCTSLQQPRCLPSSRALAARFTGGVRRDLVKPDLSTFCHISKCSEVKKKPLCASAVTTEAHLCPFTACCRGWLSCSPYRSPPGLLAGLSLHSVLSLFCSCDVSCWNALPNCSLSSLLPKGLAAVLAPWLGLALLLQLASPHCLLLTPVLCIDRSLQFSFIIARGMYCPPSEMYVFYVQACQTVMPFWRGHHLSVYSFPFLFLN